MSSHGKQEMEPFASAQFSPRDPGQQRVSVPATLVSVFIYLDCVPR